MVTAIDNLRLVLDKTVAALDYISIKASSGDPVRDALEKKLAAALSKADKDLLLRLINLLGYPPNIYNVPGDFWINYAGELNRILTVHLNDAILGEFERFVATSPVAPGMDGIIFDATKWSREYITKIANQIAQNGQKLTWEVVQDALESGLTPEDLAKRLSYRFGSAHAAMIAITELTNANSQAHIFLRGRLKELGVEARRRWYTFEDEKVCPLCGPFDHVYEDENGIFTSKTGVQSSGPAQHPYCRCSDPVEKLK